MSNFTVLLNPALAVCCVCCTFSRFSSALCQGQPLAFSSPCAEIKKPRAGGTFNKLKIVSRPLYSRLIMLGPCEGFFSPVGRLLAKACYVHFLTRFPQSHTDWHSFYCRDFFSCGTENCSSQRMSRVDDKLTQLSVQFHLPAKDLRGERAFL